MESEVGGRQYHYDRSRHCVLKDILISALFIFHVASVWSLPSLAQEDDFFRALKGYFLSNGCLIGYQWLIPT